MPEDSSIISPLSVQNTSFVFVVHGGALEAKSALLACSLRQKLLSGNRIVAACMEPTDLWTEMRPQTRALFDQLEIEMVPVRNLIDESYPHGNKIGSLGQVDGPAVFLDSDMMMIRPFILHQSLLNCDAALKPADIDTFTRGGGSWNAVYKLFGLPLPAKTMTATSTGEKMRPYFNAGFIWVRNGAEFTKAWVETARAIDLEPSINNKRPWLDQVALPVTFDRLGWQVNEVPVVLNYPAHLEEIGARTPYIAHYHWPRIVQKNNVLERDIRFYCGKFPLLREILEADTEWGEVTYHLR